MSQPRMFTEADLIAALGEIGSKLRRRISAYLIGGCAMMFIGRKVATKDIDVVFKSAHDAKDFMTAAKKAGFGYVLRPTGEYDALGTSAIIEDSRGMRFDIFDRRVCRSLELSEDMKSRAQLYGGFGNLEVYLMSPEDIFLFKGITERETDLDDMRMLAEAGLDWQTIESECLSQKRSGRWTYMLGTKLLELRAEFGISSPITKTLLEHADIDLLTHVFGKIIKEGKNTFKEISQAIKEKYLYSDSWTRKQLQVLLKSGAIEVRSEGRRYTYYMRR